MTAEEHEGEKTLRTLLGGGRADDAEKERRAWETLHRFIARHAESHVEANDLAAALSVVTRKSNV